MINVSDNYFSKAEAAPSPSVPSLLFLGASQNSELSPSSPAGMETESQHRKVPLFDSQELFTWAKPWPKGFAKATNRIQVSWVGDIVEGDWWGAVHRGCSSAPHTGQSPCASVSSSPPWKALIYVDSEKKPNSNAKRKEGFFFFCWRETVFLQTPMGLKLLF